MINKRAKGDRAVKKTLDALKELGYQAEKVEIGSGRFARRRDLWNLFDVIAVRPDAWRLIQVKSNAGIGKAKQEEMRGFLVPACTTKEVWIWRDRVSVPTIKQY
jgi:acetone carboxylase gamma subunit